MTGPLITLAANEHAADLIRSARARSTNSVVRRPHWLHVRRPLSPRALRARAAQC